MLLIIYLIKTKNNNNNNNNFISDVNIIAIYPKMNINKVSYNYICTDVSEYNETERELYKTLPDYLYLEVSQYLQN